VLVEFKAGRMFKDANTKWVRPDTRKGQVQLKQVRTIANNSRLYWSTI
jgi:hypothetical protein